jgi:hypothetical protein
VPAIHVLPGEHDDWVVREEKGRGLGHYPSQAAAEAVAHKLARKRQVELLVHDRAGKVEKRMRPGKSWLARLFNR